ncbi:hypothetical protein THF1D04_220055 [Vibrio owensii]|uniref:DDE domain-containing protein n=1 Tax=Vibrio owensii TaxID=696485 RepID=A0AAU9Q675_9VIBR|nr:hypothetical protein THF1D04_220055 [Vibrio owensii]
MIDYFLSSNRDEAAAKAFLNKTLAQNGLPEKVVIDGSKSNYAALDALNVQLWLTGCFMLSLIEILDIKYLYNIVEQSHRKHGKLWDGSQLKVLRQVFMVGICGRCSSVVR